MPKQTPATEREIMEIHQLELKGHLPEEMEASFLRKASILDSYGIDPHPVKVDNFIYRFKCRVFRINTLNRRLT